MKCDRQAVPLALVHQLVVIAYGNLSGTNSLPENPSTRYFIYLPLTEMPYSDFTLTRVKKQFDLTTSEDTDIFAI